MPGDRGALAVPSLSFAWPGEDRPRPPGPGWQSLTWDLQPQTRELQAFTVPIWQCTGIVEADIWQLLLVLARKLILESLNIRDQRGASTTWFVALLWSLMAEGLCSCRAFPCEERSGCFCINHIFFLLTVLKIEFMYQLIYFIRFFPSNIWFRGKFCYIFVPTCAMWSILRLFRSNISNSHIQSPFWMVIPKFEGHSATWWS